jgi:hypothetical protein
MVSRQHPLGLVAPDWTRISCLSAQDVFLVTKVMTTLAPEKIEPLRRRFGAQVDLIGIGSLESAIRMADRTLEVLHFKKTLGAELTFSVKIFLFITMANYMINEPVRLGISIPNCSYCFIAASLVAVFAIPHQASGHFLPPTGLILLQPRRRGNGQVSAKGAVTSPGDFLGFPI